MRLLLAALGLLMLFPSHAQSGQKVDKYLRPQPKMSYRSVAASAYGPGLYGNGTACGPTLRSSSRWVADKTLRCGTRVRLCYRGRCQTLRVEDRGPYVRGREFDITEGAIRYWGMSAQSWGVRNVKWE